MSNNPRQCTLHYGSHSLTVQLRIVLLTESSSYAADCCRRTKQLLLHVLLHTLLAQYTERVQLQTKKVTGNYIPPIPGLNRGEN